MVRRESESYKQDHLGNVRRELDDYRAREGGVAGGTDGHVDVTADDTDTDLVAYELPDHANQVILEQVMTRADDGTGGGTVTVYSATLADDGTIDTTTQRGVPLDMAAAGTDAHDIVTAPFSDDAIVINASVASEVSLGVLSDHFEESEPASEETQSA